MHAAQARPPTPHRTQNQHKLSTTLCQSLYVSLHVSLSRPALKQTTHEQPTRTSACTCRCVPQVSSPKVLICVLTCVLTCVPQVLLLKVPGLKAALGIPDIAKIQAEQATAAGLGQPAGGQAAAKAPPVIPAAVFSSRAEALRHKEHKAASAEASAEAPPAAAPLSKGKKGKRSPPGGRQMHMASASLHSRVFAAAPLHTHWRAMSGVGVGGFGR